MPKSNFSSNAAPWSSEKIAECYPEAWELIDVRAKSTGKLLTLRSVSGSKQLKTITLSRFSYLFQKDTSEQEPSLANRDYLVINEDDEPQVSKLLCNGFGELATAILKPYFRNTSVMPVANGTSLCLCCAEVVSASDYDAVRWLNKFHYRTLNMWGRSTALILRLLDEHTKRPFNGAIGYVMLNSPPLLTTPRDRLFEWDSIGRLAHVDRVVRIARVVVHPEFRGIGTGRLLVEAARSYAELHWNAAGKKPVLLETVAEMSRLHPLFQKGGMLLLGETSGREEVLITPKDKLDHQMGSGHWRSSLDRMKMKASSPKPYYAVPLSGCPIAVYDRIQLAHVAVASEEASCAQVQPPLIRFCRATIGHIVSAHIPRLSSSSLGLNQDLVPLHNEITRIHQALRRIPDEVAVDNDSHMGAYSALAGAVSQAISEYKCQVGLAYDQSSALSDSIIGVANDLARTLEALHASRSTLSQTIDLFQSALSNFLSEQHGSLKENELLRISSVHDTLRSVKVKLSRSTNSTRELEIVSAFGLDEDSDSNCVIEDFSLDIPPGSIVLLEGASGSGKSTLLESLFGKTQIHSGTITPAALGNEVANLDLNFNEHLAVIDLIDASTRDACMYLNSAGISEAKVYLKKRNQLSHGQRYRVAAAMLVASGKSVWVADEFCAFLDPLTSVMVASGIAKLARLRGATLIVAAADATRIAAALAPDIRLRLVSGGRPNPDPILRFFSGVGAALEEAKEADLSPHKYLSDNDLLYHRLTTDILEWPESQDEVRVSRLTAELSGIGQDWTMGTLRRQIGIRIALMRHARDNAN
ncbi:ATP-binding cassette domain-containing protein [Fimbriimonas ginsengisoli]|uniref:ATP-binding cassette domain-containing protein n=1 Tax=Fimbriimonas ginsengisoli TaxID=1005039 RepID=UPI00130E722A|nr:ATP-binding cassette domain-containing protein [Fimbriimonas ginsengisoli]